MEMKNINIKIGTILLYREYGFFKRLWAKITRKQLTYNKFITFTENGELVKVNYAKNNFKDCVLAELKKAYNKKETATFKNLVDSSSEACPTELFAIINAVRPGTFADNTSNLEELLDSKYYNVKQLSDEAFWNEVEYLF